MIRIALRNTYHVRHLSNNDNIILSFLAEIFLVVLQESNGYINASFTPVSDLINALI